MQGCSEGPRFHGSGSPRGTCSHRLPLNLKYSDAFVCCEAFITGYGLEEAYKRADAYHRAGADAILCHSKKKDDSDIKVIFYHFES